MHFLKQTPWLGAVAAFFLLTNSAAAASSYFAYISDRRLIAVETVSHHEVVLNVINLSDEVLVIHPYDLLLQSGSKTSLGQVFRNEEKGADSFYATRLVKSREFVGLPVEGDLFAEPDRMIFRAASRFFFLQKLDKRDFDILERRITEIDLNRADSEVALRRAGISQGYGELEYYPEGETEELSRMFPETGQALPPRVIQRTDPKAPEGISPGSELEVKGLISKKGELLDAGVSKGLSAAADQRALAVIRNSWKFLPAVLDGDVVESSVTLRVKFAE